jgi:hypothetical protein
MVKEINEIDFADKSPFDQLVELGNPEPKPIRGNISLKSFFKELLEENEANGS